MTDNREMLGNMMRIRAKMETPVDVPTEDEILLERFRKLDVPIV